MSRQRLLPPIPHPALLEQARRRAENVQNRIADRITAYAGSMHFVYLHIAIFIAWMILIEESPWPTLTLIVSLEAIFLSTFVMISQNRQAARSDLRSELDFETNIRGEIWSVHIGQRLGIDVDHVEDVVRRAIDGAHAAMRNAPAPSGKDASTKNDAAK